METIKCIKERRSVRKFKNEQIPTEVIKEIISDARYVPSWKNTQVTRYTVIQNKKAIEDITNYGMYDFEHNINILKGVSTLIVVSYKQKRCGFERDGTYSTNKGEAWQMFDTGVAIQTLCLLAQDKGIGSLIMGIYDENFIGKLINLPEDETISALVALGYPNETPICPKRKDLDVIFRVIE